ncbi:fatty acid cis/trans isomerase [Halobacteriovorax sp.]|uniref:fatty acid cis/trans isomerase n=1 Tax=Halobacteriovorax sp. TaxID=2020862 RepID=UPI0035620E7B
MKLLLQLFTILFLTISCSLSNKEQFVITNNEVIRADSLASLPIGPISYKDKVRPILDNRCVVCHGCYDAPCQLKLSSIDGIKRGANPERVYDGSRILSMKPTRLNVDAKSVSEWRSKDFHPVISDTSTTPQENLENSLIYKIIQLKEMFPQPRAGLISKEIDTSLNRRQYCAKIENFEEYVEEHSNLGMPFALPNLTHKEFTILSHWIAQGSKGNDDKDQNDKTKKLIEIFESKFNEKSKKSKLIARYIYEHLFLAHINFNTDHSRTFYRLVRARNKSGEPNEIDALRPYDDPKGEFYYRFKLYRPTIVAKSHNLYKLSHQTFKRYEDLFYKVDFKVNTLPSYEPEVASNPFIAFKDIPIKSKYSFLLDNSRFFIEGFIKGPVCRGQIALNVIEDRFWVYFADPDSKIDTNSDAFIDKYKNLLELPASEESEIEFLSIWSDFWKKQKTFLSARNQHFKNAKKSNISEAQKIIWDGDGHNPNAALTIFRHLDSASVREGLHGITPETTWVIDYPILERIHYLLVAGFNVYGNVAHQLKTRLYMDFLRMEGENLFLSFLPVENRKLLHKKWYGGNRNHVKLFIKDPSQWLNINYVTGFKTKDPLDELHTYFRNRTKRAVKSTKQSFDTRLKKLDRFKGKFLSYFPEITLLKVEDELYTIVHNKEYKFVSFFLNDASTRDSLDQENDTLTLIKGVEGSYPNLFINLSKDNIHQFMEDMANITSPLEYTQFIAKYGVRRTNSNFWKYSDWINQEYLKNQKFRAGVLDLNRYAP